MSDWYEYTMSFIRIHNVIYTKTQCHIYTNSQCHVYDMSCTHFLILILEACRVKGAYKSSSFWDLNHKKWRESQLCYHYATSTSHWMRSKYVIIWLNNVLDNILCYIALFDFKWFNSVKNKLLIFRQSWNDQVFQNTSFQ